MVAGRDQDDVQLVARLKDQPGTIRVRPPEGGQSQVRLPRLHLQRHLVVAQFLEGEANPGIAALEFDHAYREIFHQNAGRCGHDQMRLELPQGFLERALQAADARHGGMSQFREQTSGVRQSTAPTVRLDQRHAELVFQSVDLFPDRRVGQTQSRGCRREAAQASGFTEAAQLLQGHLLVDPTIAWGRRHDLTCRFSLRQIKNLLIPVSGCLAPIASSKLQSCVGKPRLQVSTMKVPLRPVPRAPGGWVSSFPTTSVGGFRSCQGSV